MTKNEAIEKIAREVLSIETLEEQKSDSKYFHTQPMWQLKKALEAAYEAGKNSE